MSPPPWVLISPSGQPHEVRDRDDLQTLPERTLEIRSDQLDDLRKLIGLRVGKSGATKLPVHKRHWQLRERVQCVRCDETGELVFIVGGDVHHFKTLTHLHGRGMATFDWGRFGTFLNAGHIWITAAGGVKVKIDYYSPKNSAFKWRLVESPPVPEHWALPVASDCEEVPARSDRAARLARQPLAL